MKRYTKALVDDESNLNEMIEAAIKQNAQEDKAASESLEEDIVDDTEINLSEIEDLISDSDFEEFSEFLEDDGLEEEGVE